jgi:hypothetical protein
MSRINRPVLIVLGVGLCLGAATTADALLIAHYSFDETSGTTLNDVSGGGNTLTFNASPTWGVPGAFGTAATVNGQGALARTPGTNPGTISNFQSITGNKVTVAFWAQPARESVGSNPFYIGTSNGGQGNRILASHLEWSDGRIYWDVDWGDGSNQRVDQVGGATADRLHHYAMTYNGDTGLMQVYKDNAILVSNTVATDTSIGWSSINNIELGAFSFHSYWPGTLDDFAIWDEPLSAFQIGNVFRLGAASYDVPEPSTFLVWSLLAGLGLGCAAYRRRR